MEHLYIAGGMLLKWYSHFGKQFGLSQKVKHRTTWHSNFYSGIYPRESKTCLNKNLYMNVSNSIFHNSSKVEST